MKVTIIRDVADDVRRWRNAVGAKEEVLRARLDLELENESAASFAERIGISEQYLCDIRKGRRKISGPVLESLCGLKASR